MKKMAELPIDQNEEIEMKPIEDNHDNDDDNDDIYIDDSFDSKHSPTLPPYIHSIPRELDYYDEEEQAKISLGKRAIDKIKSYFQDSKYKKLDAVEMEDTSLWGRVKGSGRFVEIKVKFGNFIKDLPKELRKKLGESFHTKLQRNAWLNDEATRRQNILREENDVDQNNHDLLNDEETDNHDLINRRKNEIQTRIVSRSEQIDRIQKEIDERNREDMKTIDRLPIKERVRAIFKKYGLTVASILLAIWAVLATIIGATKSGGSAQKEITQIKTIPILKLNKSERRTIINFILNAAMDVIEDLVENAWILIEMLIIFNTDKN